MRKTRNIRHDMAKPSDHQARIERARIALDGLSVGDAFGERFFTWPPEIITQVIAGREMRESWWRYTDDTEMALSITQVLEVFGHIDQDELATLFALRYAQDPRRGYGGMAHEILRRLGQGEAWSQVSPAVFNGTGSLGNGGAMRVAPVGGYFADDYDLAVEHARRSAEVTHAHPEGQAGAIAVAVATAWAWQNRDHRGTDVPFDMLEFVASRTPDGATREGIDLANTLIGADLQTAARRLGTGQRVTAPDTVPFCLWVAARHLRSYADALWETASVFGDVDTNCAIVGGIIALSVGRDGIPAEWLAAREELK
jgi:ADP-ribosylglycohydrolase